LRHADPPLLVGNSNSVIITVLEEALKPRMKLIRGYTGEGLDIAFEAGEVQAQGTSYANLTGFKPEWLKNNFVRIMTQFGSGKRIAALPDVPTARELAQNDEDRALIEFSEGSLTLGFPIAAPPGVPADRVAILREAFRQTMADPAFRADGEKAKLEYSPRSGAELEAAILKYSTTPPEIRERYKKLLGQSTGR
jgi:tripartite-type tricarboxylate transporter receptor subunit TctC